jgi:hypothetical protein
MKREAWTPILPTGEIDAAELRRPAETAEPTTWEAQWIPGDGWDAAGDFALLDMARVTRANPQHRFIFVAADPGKVEAWRRWSADEDDDNTAVPDFPENVTIAVGPIATQAEADRDLPALLGVKAALREAVFAPREAIDLARTGALGCSCEDEDRCSGTCAFYRYAADKTKRLDAVRVRGGETPILPAHVRALQEQAAAAGVPFSLAWGEWVPLGQTRCTAFGDVEMRCPFGRIAGVFAKLGAARSGCALDGVDYPEEG